MNFLCLSIFELSALFAPFSTNIIYNNALVR